MLLSLFGLIVSSSAQDVKYTNYFNVPSPIKTESYRVTFKNPVSKYNYCKVGLQIDNLTNSFLLFKKEESNFTFDFGKFQAKKKSIVIRPNNKKMPTLKVEGANQFLVNNYTLNLSGFYRVPINGRVIKMEDFKLPANKSIIKSENIEVKILKLKKKTQETLVTFEVRYYGDKIAIIDESNLVVKIESGEEFINDHTKARPKLLEKGGKIKIKALFHIPAKTADMQFENMLIVWKNTFIESKIIAVPSEVIKFTINEGLTKGKNK